MIRQPYVANSSPLIVFQRIGRFSLIRDLLGQLYVPTAVRREVFASDPLPDWIEERVVA